jgi:hypothetical protein
VGRIVVYARNLVKAPGQQDFHLGGIRHRGR